MWADELGQFAATSTFVSLSWPAVATAADKDFNYAQTLHGYTQLTSNVRTLKFTRTLKE